MEETKDRKEQTKEETKEQTKARKTEQIINALTVVKCHLSPELLLVLMMLICSRLMSW